MNILHDAIELLIQPPGDLVYFLVTLFALQQALFPAVTARRAAPDDALPNRWTWAIGGMLAGRAVLGVIGLLSNASLINPVLVIPPLERLLEIASIALVLWALQSRKPARWQTWVLIALLVASLGFYLYDTFALWPAQFERHAYNGTTQEWIWEILALILLIAGVAIQVIQRETEWEWTTGLLLFWALGHIAQMFWPVATIHFSDWERLTALVVLPLLAMLVQRQIVVPAPAPAPYEPPRRASRSRKKEQLPELDVKGLQILLQGIEAARELDPALIIASSRLAQLLNAEFCAIGLQDQYDPPQIRIVATHPPTGQLDAPILNLEDYNTILESWEKFENRVIQDSDEPPWLDKLHSEIGFSIIGPLSILPLCYQDKCLGMLFLGNPRNNATWQKPELASQQLVAALLAGAIGRLQQKGGSIFAIREQDEQMVEDLENTQEEVRSLNAQISQLKQDIQERDTRMDYLNQQMKQQAPANETELGFWQEEVKRLASDMDTMTQERNRLNKELEKLQPRLEQLMGDRTKLLKQLSYLKKTLEAAQQRATTPDNRVGGLMGLIVADEDGMILMADAMARQMLRLPQGEVKGAPLNCVYPAPQWAQAIDALLTKEGEGKSRDHMTLDVANKAIEADLVALEGQENEPQALVVTLRTEESLVEQQEAIAAIVNEVRTPMTSLIGYTDLLLGEQVGILNEMQQQFLERVKANVEEMKQQLNDLIGVVTPDTRRVALTPEPVDLITIIEEAIMGLSARFRERQLGVRMDLPPELAPVRADRDSLYQIMLRLLSNAVLCSEEGTEILVNAQEQTPEEKGQMGFVRISVTDTGGGIASEDYPRVFRRFYRAHQPLVAGLGETGIGMAVAKTLVEANGGRIWVETDAGKGSTFSFILPAQNGG